MKVIVVYLGDVLNCPPAMSLINCLNETNNKTVFICYRSQLEQFSDFADKNKNAKFVYIGNSNTKSNPIKKVFKFINYKRLLRRIIQKEYDSDSMIWVLSNGTLKYFGRYLLKLRYVLHLLELTERLYLIESKHLIPLSIKYAKNAIALIECEYNRAHITKAWWGLKKVPFVLENKPFNHSEYRRDEPITSSRNISCLFDDVLKNRKIILYQGNISNERPLGPFIEAVSELGDDYAFVAMTNGDVGYSGSSRNFYQLPFVAPPKHLEITSRAYIGIITYTPVKNSYSILNTLYCAPNKIWEYSAFSVPMLGNDLPALNNHFLKYRDGECISSFNKEEIKSTIMKIDNNHGRYSQCSKQFYESYDYKKEVERIISFCKTQNK